MKLLITAMQVADPTLQLCYSASRIKIICPSYLKLSSLAYLFYVSEQVLRTYKHWGCSENLTSRCSFISTNAAVNYVYANHGLHSAAFLTHFWFQIKENEQNSVREWMEFGAARSLRALTVLLSEIGREKSIRFKVFYVSFGVYKNGID